MPLYSNPIQLCHDQASIRNYSLLLKLPSLTPLYSIPSSFVMIRYQLETLLLKLASLEGKQCMKTHMHYSWFILDDGKYSALESRDKGPNSVPQYPIWLTWISCINFPCPPNSIFSYIQKLLQSIILHTTTSLTF